MHISTLFLNTYSPEKPLTGHIDVNVEGSMVKVVFLENECAEIQAIAVRAWERKQAAIAQAILSDVPAVRALPAPSEAIEDAEYSDVGF